MAEPKRSETVIWSPDRWLTYCPTCDEDTDSQDDACRFCLECGHKRNTTTDEEYR